MMLAVYAGFRALQILEASRSIAQAALQINAPAAWVEWVGFVAAFCTTAAFVPQLLRVFKLKTARDISLYTFLLFSSGVALWLVYGIYSGSKPVIASNLVTLVLSLSILFLKLKYDRAGRRSEIRARRRDDES